MDGTCFSTINYIDYLNEFYLKDSSEKAHILIENYIPKNKEDERSARLYRKADFNEKISK